MSKTVRYEVDLNNLPPLTEAQKAEIETLAAMPDDQIDTSDIPELGEAFWKTPSGAGSTSPPRLQPRCAWMRTCWRGSRGRARATRPA